MEERTEGRGDGQQPLYDTFSGHFKPGTNAIKFPYANQSDEYSYLNTTSGGSIQMFSTEQLPIKKAISESYGVFNKLFCAVPSSPQPPLHSERNLVWLDQQHRLPAVRWQDDAVLADGDVRHDVARQRQLQLLHELDLRLRA